MTISSILDIYENSRSSKSMHTYVFEQSPIPLGGPLRSPPPIEERVKAAQMYHKIKI